MARTEHVLIVCVGNICRSPMAEVILRRSLVEENRISVASAGLAAMVGSPIDPMAQAVLSAHGLTAESHLARQLERPAIDTADVVLVMDRKQRAALLALAPHARHKISLLGRWHDDLEIPDPYRRPRPAFEHTYQMIESAITCWCEYF